MENQPVSELNMSKKKNYTPVIIAGVVLLLCCCLVIAAAVFFSVRSQGGSGFSLPSYNGIADPERRTDTMKLLGEYEAAIGCENIMLTSGQVLNPPQNDAGGVWTEMWQVSACGESHLYSVTFSPDPAGGTNIQAVRADQ